MKRSIRRLERLRRLRHPLMTGFWTSETMQVRLPGLIDRFAADRVQNCSYELSLGNEVYVTGPEATTKRTLAPGAQLSIPPGQFAQLLTEEIIEVPADALGLISMKSAM